MKNYRHRDQLLLIFALVCQSLAEPHPNDPNNYCSIGRCQMCMKISTTIGQSLQSCLRCQDSEIEEVTGHSFTFWPGTKLYTCKITPHPKPNCKLSSNVSSGIISPECGVCQIGFFAKFLGNHQDGYSLYDCVADNAEDNPWGQLLHYNLPVCKQNTVPDLVNNESYCIQPTGNLALIPNCKYHTFISGMSQSTKIVCFACNSGYGLSFSRDKCLNVPSLEGPITLEPKLTFNWTDDLRECNYLEGYYAHDSRTCLKSGQAPSTVKSIINNDCDSKCANCRSINWNDNNFVSWCMQCHQADMDSNGKCKTGATSITNCDRTMTTYLGEPGYCLNCLPGFKLTLKDGAENNEQRECSQLSPDCKLWLWSGNSAYCSGCDNGMNIEGGKCVSGGISLPNCKYSDSTTTQTYCRVCNRGYFRSQTVCVRSSQYLGSGFINPLIRSAYQCDSQWSETGIQIAGDKFLKTCQAPSDYVSPPAPEKVKNFCTPGKCATCLRIGDHYSCSRCFDSQISFAEDIDGNSYYRCQGTDTGIANCSILQSPYNRYYITAYPNYTGCYMCKPGFQLKADTASKKFECEQTTIFNCEISLFGSSQIYCKYCSPGYMIKQSNKTCGQVLPQDMIPNCKYHSLPYNASKPVCSVCNTGYGVTNDQTSCVSDSSTKGCFEPRIRGSEVTCEWCEVSTGFYAVLEGFSASDIPENGGFQFCSEIQASNYLSAVGDAGGNKGLTNKDDGGASDEVPKTSNFSRLVTGTVSTLVVFITQMVLF